jgi:chromosome segregation ATPase
MAVTHNFRSALGGFHREDVVHYIEYMNTKHASQISQLTTEAEELRAKVKALESVPVKEDRTPELEEQCSQLTAQLEEVRAANAVLEAECEALRAQKDALEAAQAEIEALKAQMAQMHSDLQAKELDAYRRAERTERLAQERADRIYQQATGTLAQATTQVDTAANLFRQIADRVNSQMEELQLAVESSKNALQDAATTMYSIRPEE